MDLRLDPHWHPLRATFSVGPWKVDLWSEPRLPGEVSGDPFLVRVRGDTLRLAVADPSHTNPSHTKHQVARASHDVITSLSVGGPLVESLEAANGELHDPSQRPIANLTASVAVVDVSVTGAAALAARAGDVEVWLPDPWRPMFAQPRLLPAAQAAFEAHPGHLVESGPGMHFQAHLDTLDDPASWLSAPLGLSPTLRDQRHHLLGVTELVVSSDGARLTPARLTHLDDWLENGLQVAPADHPHLSPHGDVTVLHLYRA